MGRRRRRVIKVVKKALPKVYSCPQCGTISIKISVKKENIAKIACGNCGLSYEYELNTNKAPIDIYNDFVDKFLSGRLNLNDGKD
ncbi:MAG: hypothetical protein L6M37_04810 [Candidatus Methylarchaceae archaeon HK02M1]|nr:hypothetical protein [Candidatus Methylarchaceae archaeon HK01M]MCP8312255.1 hypothetical protein [Candidatus Methylarchaceae archaeon HK02M1]